VLLAILHEIVLVSPLFLQTKKSESVKTEKKNKKKSDRIFGPGEGRVAFEDLNSDTASVHSIANFFYISFPLFY